MNTSKKRHSKRSSQHRTGFGPASQAGWAIFLAATGGAALAQDQAAAVGSDSSEPIEEVIVSGIRKSIQDSIDVKKADSSIVARAADMAHAIPASRHAQRKNCVR